MDNLILVYFFSESYHMASEYGECITFLILCLFCSLKALFCCIEQSSSDILLKFSFCVPGKKKYIHKVFVIMKQISFILTVDVTICWQDLQCCQMFTFRGIIPYFMALLHTWLDS